MSRWRWLLPAALGLTACTAILGVHDLTYDPNADGGGDDGGGGPDGGGTDSPTSDGPTGDGACAADLQTDPKNCGRCGRDCLGAMCASGACADTVLLSGLDNPNGILVDGAYVYLTLYSSGTVLREKKSGGTAEILATGQTNPRGVASDGTTLYWSNGDFDVDGGAPSNGGVWKCTIANCKATTSLVTGGDWAFNVQLANGMLHFTENNGSAVTRVLPNGTGRQSITTSPHPFAVAADNQHIYFNHDSPNLERAEYDSGGIVDFAPYGPGFMAKGFIVLDATRVYYTFTDSNDKGQAVSAPKDPVGAPKIQYGLANDPAVGIAVDDTYVYWATEKEGASGDPDGSGGKLLACKKTGCVGDPIVLLQTGTGGVVAADGTAVYFGESGIYGQPNGKLHMIARP